MIKLNKNIILFLFTFHIYNFAHSNPLDEFITSALKAHPSYQVALNETQKNSQLNYSSQHHYYPKLSVEGGYLHQSEPSGSKKGTIGYLQGQYSLYRGGQDRNFQKLTQINEWKSQTELELLSKELIFQMKEFYYINIYLKKILFIKNQEKNKNKTFLNLGKKRSDSGVSSQVEQLEFQMREDELEAEIQNLQGELDRFNFRKTELFGDMDLNRFLNDDLPTPQKIEIGNIENASQNNPKFKMTQLDVQQKEMQQKIKFGEFLPELNFYAKYGQIDPLVEMAQHSWNQYSFSLLLTVPLFSGFKTYHDHKAAVLDVFNSEKLKHQELIHYQMDVQLLYSEYKELMNLYDLNQKKIERYESLHAFILNEYKRGIRNSSDLIQATEAYFRVQIEKVDIKKKLAILKAKLEKNSINFS